jgi:tetratricopeptide (TPR) repeat protein
MTFQTDRPIYQICAVFLILTMSFWLCHDFLAPQRLLAQTSSYGFLEKGKIQWENLEIDEAIKALEKALQMGLTRTSDQIEAHKLLAFCWATKREEKKAEAEFQKILQIDSGFMLPDDASPIFLEPFRQAKAKVKPSDNNPPEIYLV